MTDLNNTLQDITTDIKRLYKRLQTIELTGFQSAPGTVPAAGVQYNHLEDNGVAWTSVTDLTMADDAALNFGPGPDGIGQFVSANNRVEWSGVDWLFDQIDVLIDGSGAAPASPDGTLHVHTASAGAVTATADGDDGVFENSADCGISILSPAADTGAVYFGSPTSATRGFVAYTHAADKLLFGVESNGQFEMTADEFTVLAGNWISATGIRATLANAVGLYAPWITGDVDATAFFGSTDAANNQNAIEAFTDSGYGVLAYSADTVGVQGSTATGLGVEGVATGAGTGVYAKSATGDGLVVNLTGAGTAIASFQDNGGNIFDILDGGNILLTSPATLDLNGIADCLILDADGDTTISAPTDDQIDIEIAGADDFTFTANSFNVLTGSTITMADNAWIGLGAAAGRIEFDNQATDEVNILSANVGIGVSAPTGKLVVGADFGALSGTRITVADASAVSGLNFGEDVNNRGFVIWNNTVDVINIGTVVGGVVYSPTIAMSDGKLGVGTLAPGSLTEWNFATEDLEFVDAGSAGATEQDWVEVQVGGVTGYIRIFAAK